MLGLVGVNVIECVSAGLRSSNGKKECQPALHMCIYIKMYVCMYVYIYIERDTYIYIYIYIYMYIERETNYNLSLNIRAASVGRAQSQ